MSEGANQPTRKKGAGRDRRAGGQVRQGQNKRGKEASLKRNATAGERKTPKTPSSHIPYASMVQYQVSQAGQKKRNPGGRCNSQLPKVHLVDVLWAQSGRGSVRHPIVIPTHLAGLGGWATGAEGGA